MDEDITDLLGKAPENVEDLETVEAAVEKLKQVYQTISKSVELEKEEEMKKLERMVIGPIVDLFNVGYSRNIVRKLLLELGFKPDLADRFILSAWAEMEKRRRLGKLVKAVEILAIAGIILGLILVGLSLFQQTKPEPCSSLGCVNEILHCENGKYSYEIGGTQKIVTISNQGEYCLVREEIIKSQNKSEIGKYINCQLPIKEGLTDIEDTSKCEGTLARLI